MPMTDNEKVFKGYYSKGVMYFYAENKEMAIEHAQHCCNHRPEEFGTFKKVVYQGRRKSLKLISLGEFIPDSGAN